MKKNIESQLSALRLRTFPSATGPFWKESIIPTVILLDSFADLLLQLTASHTITWLMTRVNFSNQYGLAMAAPIPNALQFAMIRSLE